MQVIDTARPATRERVVSEREKMLEDKAKAVKENPDHGVAPVELVGEVRTAVKEKCVCFSFFFRSQAIYKNFNFLCSSSWLL